MRLSILSFFIVFSSQIFCQNDRIFVEEGDKVFNFGDYEDAILFYQLALEENPKNVRAHYMTGTCFLITTSEKKEAVFYLEKAYELDTEVSTDILFKIGEGYRYRYEFKDAIEYYKRFLNELKVNSRAFKGEDIESLTNKTDRRILECENAKGYMDTPVLFKGLNLGDNINSIAEDYSPTLNKDETLLFFTSKREGSTGGLKDTDNKYFEDIWVSKKIDGEWGKPSNLGTTINTDQHDSNLGLSPDESKLFIYNTENKGDIYYSEYENGAWQKAKPMEDDINTEFQETSICISGNGKYLFFTSSRPGGEGELDLYLKRKTEKGKWSKARNIGNVINTKYSEEGPFFDQKTSTLYFSSKGHSGMGGYDLYKTVWDTISNTFGVPENLGFPINSVDDELFFTISSVTGHPYYASFNEDSKGYQDLYMIVPVDEDEKQDENVEDSLSKVSSFIADQELQVFDTTFRKIVVKDATSGVIITGETVVKVYPFEDQQSEMSPINGKKNFYEFICNKQTEFVVVGESEGYLFQTKNVVIQPSEVDEVEVIELFLEKKAIYNTKVLRNIYFDFDKYTLDGKSSIELDQLAEMIKNSPSMVVEIAGHTDFKGSEQYNNSLSLKRADAVRKYLISKDIIKDQVVAKGYGEKYPIASNDDEIDGRALNRRIEFIILQK